MNHLFPKKIPNYGLNTKIYPSFQKANVLIVFVHGFMGESEKTWGEFNSIINTSSEFDKSDVVFYGYESRFQQATISANDFFSFLVTVLGNTTTFFNRLYKKRVNRSFEDYNKIIIVGHSLGAIIIRRALLFAKQESKVWLDKIETVLIAPAHNGARVTRLAFAALDTFMFLKVFTKLGRYLVPVLDDLEPNSQTIINLKEDSIKYLKLGEGDFTIAKTVLWAVKEKVVYSERFCEDPIPVNIHNKNHMNICRPNIEEGYMDPFNHIVELLPNQIVELLS